MPASYPKPDGQKVNRVEPKHGWVNLPAAGRDGPPPRLPGWRQWQPATRVWWKALWAKPQATQWQQDGSTLVVLACLYDDLIAQRSDATKVSTEMRQHEDRHGLNPKAMLQLLWRVVDDDGVEQAAPASVSSIGERRARIKVT